MTLAVLRRQWDKARLAAEVNDFRWHDLRHTFGTRANRAAGLKTTSKLLGHSDIGTTAKYAHADEDDMRAALEAVESRNAPGKKMPDAEFIEDNQRDSA